MNTNEIVDELATAANFIVTHVADDLTGRSLEELVELQDSLAELGKRVGDALSLLNTEQVKQLEGGARIIGDKLYKRVPKYKETHDHGRVHRAIREAAKEFALDRASGEFNLDAAVDKAVVLTFETYSSASTNPKAKALEGFDLARKDVTSKERIGYKTEVINIGEEQDDDG